MRTASALVLLVLLAGCASAPATTAPVPDPNKAPGYFDSLCTYENDRRFVFDYIGLMRPVAGNGLTYGEDVELGACDLYQEDGVHLALVLVPNLGGHDLDSYAVDLVRAWGLGDEQRLDGLLVLYTADDGFGRPAVRVEVGYGLEGVVNANVAREAVDGIVALKKSRIENGSSEPEATAHALAAGTNALALFTQSNHEGVAGEASGDGGGFRIQWWMILIAVVVLMSLLGRRGRGVGGFAGGMILGGMMRRGGRGGGGFGGGRSGGGGFGGGKSGGGGWGGRF
ncbi:MAG: TPM domain-containing protein [Candidatus Thermoplasmatota archaeon]